MSHDGFPHGRRLPMEPVGAGAPAVEAVEHVHG